MAEYVNSEPRATDLLTDGENEKLKKKKRELITIRGEIQDPGYDVYLTPQKEEVSN